MRALIFALCFLFAGQVHADFPPRRQPIFDDERDSWMPIIAAVVGGTVGFGSGHLLLGTYLDAGWKFTLLDSATLAALLAANHNCANVDRSCSVRVAAGTALAGVRIWETLDAPYSWILKVSVQPSPHSFHVVTSLSF